jgi:hypothetical protein
MWNFDFKKIFLLVHLKKKLINQIMFKLDSDISIVTLTDETSLCQYEELVKLIQNSLFSLEEHFHRMENFMLRIETLKSINSFSKYLLKWLTIFNGLIKQVVNKNLCNVLYSKYISVASNEIIVKSMILRDPIFFAKWMENFEVIFLKT